ncbi:MAG: FAD:protein FMN transferase, partial [Verrucomicrobiota bacterium]
MANRRHFLNLSTGAAAALLSPNTALSRSNTLPKHTRCARALGTDVKLTVLHDDPNVANKAIDAALQKIEQVEQLMSLYRPDSELNQLNRKGVLRNPHSDLVEVLNRSIELSRLTEGAFDITVQPLWNLYSDHSSKGALPSDAEIERVQKRLGWQHIRIEQDLIYFDRAGMQLTLNGVAQGLAADMAECALKENGIEHALIDAGELNAFGNSGRRDQWNIAVKHPRERGEIAKTGLENRCLSTSGDYASRFSEDFRHHHLIDPRSGRSPVEWSSVTVAAPTALEADALSTALFILGPDEATKIVESMEKVDALFVSKSGDVTVTEGFNLI